MHKDAIAVIATLGLDPHPEGGYYRETFRSSLSLADLPHGSPRAASTAIYYLLPSNTFSALHRVGSDEVWHHYDGDPVDLHTIDGIGMQHTVTRLGRNYAAGERSQHVVTAGLWQAAVPVGERYALCGCTVAPGFDFADFTMPDRATMLGLLPAHRALVEKLTRP